MARTGIDTPAPETAGRICASGLGSASFVAFSAKLAEGLRTQAERPCWVRAADFSQQYRRFGRYGPISPAIEVYDNTLY